jgi:hypothetical protein
MLQDFLFTLLHNTYRNMAGTTNLQKKNANFPKKKYMFGILKLKRANNSYGGYPTDFFPRDRQKFQAASQLLENIPDYTKQNKIKSKLILIYTVLNKN